MYPTSNSFVFRASFSSARNRSNSMRNNDSSRLMAGTGSIRSCGGASGSNRMIGLRLVAAHSFGMGKDCRGMVYRRLMPKYQSCATRNKRPIGRDSELQCITETVRRLALVNVVSRVFFDAIIQRLPDL